MATDLVVGIDVGMTGTAVAYKSKRDARPKAFTWGKDVKVPTRLFYSDRHQPPKLVGWGLEVPDDSQKPFTTRELFKVDFGNREKDQIHVENLYTDFLGCLYQELRLRQFTPQILGGKSFEECTIHFLFSVPATWDPALVSSFKQLISNAGFDDAKDHIVYVSMTEPQAVAAFQMCGSQLSKRTKDGDKVLIVDAGGGTSDFCLLRLQDTFHGTSKVNKSSQAIEIQPVFACGFGSVHIDEGFQSLVKEHVKSHRGLLHKSPEQVAWHVRDTDEYRECKHSLGTKSFEDFTFEIPFQKTNAGDPASLPRIDPFILTETSMASLFDTQIDRIKEVIKSFLADLEKREEAADTGRNVVILAGGLGSSPYFKGKIQQLVATSLVKLGGKTEVFASDNPRLAVCLGLIYHAGRSPQLFPRRLHRVSLGIASQGLKNAIKQSRLGYFVKKSLFHLSMGGKAEKAVDWIALKGTPVGDLGFFTVTQKAKFSPDLPPEKRIWEVAILTSFENATEKLMVEENCRVRSILNIDLSRAPQLSGSTGAREALSRLRLAPKPDVVIEVTVVVQVGLATIEFQWIDSKGFRCSDPISIPTGDERLPSTDAVYELS
ncbi:hypothetical protein FPRO05_02583 [Fusarium proliferatum]|uniref:Actin-like ATPase domain-containing protein n=1 Tax=Gibberella intermedia TaxID=948311 RepID=A0A365MZ29_GIBIN|nr:hypothetical protein FPRO05_02583 [Fusarium proliferatum]